MSIKKLKGIQITFENLDYIRINSELLVYLDLKRISKQISFSRQTNITREYYVIDGLKLGIFIDKLNETNHSSSFENTNEENFDDDKPEPTESIKDVLLKYRNILYIDLIYEDGTTQEYYVNWKNGSDDYTNLGQTNEMAEYPVIIRENATELYNITKLFKESIIAINIEN